MPPPPQQQAAATAAAPRSRRPCMNATSQGSSGGRRTCAASGLGLGLALARALAEMGRVCDRPRARQPLICGTAPLRLPPLPLARRASALPPTEATRHTQTRRSRVRAHTRTRARSGAGAGPMTPTRCLACWARREKSGRTTRRRRWRWCSMPSGIGSVSLKWSASKSMGGT